MKAWLIKWTSSSGEEALADILSARLVPKTVGYWMERLYSQATASIQEKLDQARYSKPARLPFRSHQGKKLVDGRVGIHCGDDPFLEARLVSDLRVETTEDGLDVLHYVDGQRRKSIERGRLRVDATGQGIDVLRPPSYEALARESSTRP